MFLYIDQITVCAVICRCQAEHKLLSLSSRCAAVCRRPYTTSEQQVLEFFSGYNVQEVAFVYEPDGRPSGLVCCGKRAELSAQLVKLVLAQMQHSLSLVILFL